MSKLEKMEFRRVLWGFKPREVREELARMNESHQEAVANYQQQIKSLTDQYQNLTAQRTELQNKIAVYQSRQNLLAETLLCAQEEANKIVAEARQQAENLINSARQQLERKQAELKAIEQQQQQFKQGFEQLYKRLQQDCAVILNQYDTAIGADEVSPDDDDYQPFIPGYLDMEEEGGEFH